MCPDLGNVPGAIPLLAWEKRRQFGELGPLARWPVKGDLPRRIVVQFVNPEIF